VGLSRKSFLARLAGTAAPADARLAGSIAGALTAVRSGAQMVRAHDVAQTRQALLFQAAVENG
jgi:dihydropteroate synthase